VPTPGKIHYMHMHDAVDDTWTQVARLEATVDHEKEAKLGTEILRHMECGCSTLLLVKKFEEQCVVLKAEFGNSKLENEAADAALKAH